MSRVYPLLDGHILKVKLRPMVSCGANIFQSFHPTRHLNVLLMLLALGSSVKADRVTPPKQHFGFDIGQDYQLANHVQLLAYYERLAKETKRIRIEEIGKSEEGRPIKMAIITSPRNQRRLERLKSISARLAWADGVTHAEAAKLTKEGCSVVWIDGGLHATETLGAQQLIETVYRLCSREDEETKRILDDVVVLCVLVNPDGMDLVSDWYMRNPDPTKRSLSGIPRLYQKYIGHDNNRDFFAVTQSETRAVNQVLYRTWRPQILYNHHQTGPAGTVMFAPPFRDPFNYHVDPLVTNGIDRVGAAMMERFLVNGMGGVTTRSGAPYSTWWNGGLRTTAYFHNIIGILTETIGNPTPTRVPFINRKQQPTADLLLPVEPGDWHMQQSVEYSFTANMAILNYASKHRVDLLQNSYLMGSRAIAAGKSDTWTFSPSRLVGPSGSSREGSVGARSLAEVRTPALRDPKAYIIPSSQPDFATATKFVNALIDCGIEVRQLTQDTQVNGKHYPSGSFYISCAQAYRAHILDMFEPQDHPNDFAYPGGPPVAPYDIAGWTLALQMGIQFDRLLDQAPTVGFPIQGRLTTPSGMVTSNPGDRYFLLDPRQNGSHQAVNLLQASGVAVHRTPEAVGELPPGAFAIENRLDIAESLKFIAQKTGSSFRGAGPLSNAKLLAKPRIALLDVYGGSMPSGWTRWILEQFEFPFTVIYPPDLDAGSLSTRFDVVLLPSGIASFGTGAVGRAREGDEPAPTGGAPSQRDESDIPAEYRGRRGRVTSDRTLPQLKQFLNDGGTVISIGSSTSLAQALGLPMANYLVDGGGRALPRDQFYVPGSVLRVRLDPTHPLTWGMGDEVDTFFQQSPVYRMGDGIKRVGWFENETPLRSGWAWGQKALKGGTAFAEAQVGKGKLVLLGTEVLFRGQPHGTFKLVFNAIINSRTSP